MCDGKKCPDQVFPRWFSQVFPRLYSAGHRTSFLKSPCIWALMFPAARSTLRGLRITVGSAQAGPIYSRRLASRVATPEGVWVYWRCNGMDNVSRVRDLSAGGLFIDTAVTRPLGEKAKLDFLVQEGQIRTEAVVRHIRPSGGLGLKFTAITEEDCPHLIALMRRVHKSMSPSRFPAAS